MTSNSPGTGWADCSHSGAISCGPSFARLLLDLGRFFRNARAVLDDPDGDRITIGEFLERGRYGRGLTDHFLAPMGAAIWSSSPARMREMPARFFVRFFDNHGLLGVRDAPQWYTIEGGSQSYVHALCARLRGRVALGAPVRSVRRDDGGVEVSAGDAAPERFDRVILACHPDQALALLADPSDDERDSLARLPYTSNETVVHTGDATAAQARCRARGLERGARRLPRSRPPGQRHVLAQPPARVLGSASSTASR